ncbi:unnamed protein product [Phytophthora fragariaefolia]|uniref:Unnamed protein product n=1 Tax=Phytophthora fragariaefolia TaxID=1490495 RepID=A0A9W6TQR0_9STRA|nr:unnamed protein product [Phytophthora fragariaefolia]
MAPRPTPPRQDPRHSIGSLELIEATGKVEYLRLLHRVTVFAIAMWYVSISAQACVASITVLRGFESKDLGTEVHESTLIVGYAGKATITESPLVQNVLGGSTDLRNDTIYLVTDTTYSFTECTGVEYYDSTVYGNDFTRVIFTSLQRSPVNNLQYLSDLELIAPVIDCTFDLLVSVDEAVSQLRMYFLARQKNNTSETMLLSALISTQDFLVDQQYQSGAALLATIALISDMRATEMNHTFALAFNYPYRTGGYIDDPIAQSNIEIVIWNLQDDPATELREWRWHSLSSLRDSWAWTHSIHGIFVVAVQFDLVILWFVIFRRMRQGHVWVGDAFATISNSLLYRGILIFVANHFNGYWTLTEFCLAIGNTLGNRQNIHYRRELVHADLLTFFMNITSIISYLFRERIDPVLAFAAFEFGFAYRVEIVDSLPALRNIIVDFC